MTFDLPVCSLVVKAGGINAENDIDRSTIILALIGFRQNHYPYIQYFWHYDFLKWPLFIEKILFLHSQQP